jgi:hypothetical protein
MAKTANNPEWTEFERFRKQYASILETTPWVAVRGKRILGTYESFTQTLEALKKSQGKGESLGAAFHRDDERIEMTLVALVG